MTAGDWICVEDIIVGGKPYPVSVFRLIRSGHEVFIAETLINADVVRTIGSSPEKAVLGLKTFLALLLRGRSRVGHYARISMQLREVPDIDSALSLLDKLEAEGQLQPPRIPYQQVSIDDFPVTALTLSVAHTCNLRCRYCYAQNGSYGSEAMMSISIAKSAIDFLSQECPIEDTARIVFFGGEPLLNFEVIRFATEYALETFEAQNRGVTFAMVTNGLLLNDDIIKFLIEHRFSLVISLDGVKRVQDAQRPSTDGEGSYDQTITRLRAYLSACGGYTTVKSVITHHNLGLAENVRHFRELGFKGIRVSCVDCTRDSPYFLKKEDLEHLQGEFEQVAEFFLDQVRRKQYFVFSPFHRMLMNIHWDRFPRFGCFTGIDRLAVDPYGIIYPCFRLFGLPEYAMGSVGEGYDPSFKQMLLNNPFTERSPCVQCWARYLCGDKCYANALLFNGSINKTYTTRCSLNRHIGKLALYLYSQLSEEDKLVLLGPDSRLLELV